MSKVFLFVFGGKEGVTGPRIVLIALCNANFFLYHCCSPSATSVCASSACCIIMLHPRSLFNISSRLFKYNFLHSVVQPIF
jgi:hypothetical protein